jgi:hypothetical protein
MSLGFAATRSEGSCAEMGDRPLLLSLGCRMIFDIGISAAVVVIALLAGVVIGSRNRRT